MPVVTLGLFYPSWTREILRQRFNSAKTAVARKKYGKTEDDAVAALCMVAVPYGMG
jgi:hypothetical protein